jgi:hypothetical protein
MERIHNEMYCKQQNNVDLRNKIRSNFRLNEKNQLIELTFFIHLPVVYQFFSSYYRSIWLFLFSSILWIINFSISTTMNTIMPAASGYSQ